MALEKAASLDEDLRVLRSQLTLCKDELSNQAKDLFSNQAKHAAEVLLLKNELMKITNELGNLLLIYICNFHVLSHLLLIYICKLHWNYSCCRAGPNYQVK